MYYGFGAVSFTSQCLTLFSGDVHNNDCLITRAIVNGGLYSTRSEEFLKLLFSKQKNSQHKELNKFHKGKVVSTE